MEKLAIKLQAVREALMFTIQTLAMELNLNGYSISKSAIKMYEEGEVEPPVSYLKALVDILGVSPFFLLSEGSQIVKPITKPMVFVPFFDSEEIESKENWEKAKQHPIKYVAIPSDAREILQ